MSSADFAFDQPLKGVPRTPGKTSASFALVRALNIPGPVGREGVQKLACWLAQRYEMRNAVLRFAWLVSSRSPSLPKARPTSSLPLPRAAGQSASNRRTMAVGELRPPLARAAVMQRAVAVIDDGRRR